MQLTTTGDPGTTDYRAGAGISALVIDDPTHPVDLCRVFVELMVGRGLEAVGTQAGSPPPAVDWDAIWSAGDEAPSLERAVGRIVIAAYEAVRAQGAGPAALDEMDRLLVQHRARPETGAAPLLVRPEGETPVRRDWIDAGATFVGTPPTVNPTANPVAPPTSPPPAPPTAAVPAAFTLPDLLPELHPEPPDHPPEQLPDPQAAPTIQVVPLAKSPRAVTILPPTGAPSPPAVPVPAVSRPKADQRLPVTFQFSAYSFFTWMFYVGGIIILFVGWQLWGTGIGENHAQSALQTQFETLVHSAHRSTKATTTKAPTLLPVTDTVASPPEGSVVAKLDIPAIGAHVYVVEGTAESDLSKGPGHYIGTAVPGQAGNVAIAGHRTTYGAPFNRLNDLKVGDQIELTDTAGAQFTYAVAQVPYAVPPSDVAILNYFGDNRLTLTTCNPEWSASQRLIVVAKLVTQGPTRTIVPVAPARSLVHVHVVNGATSGWRMSRFPLVLLVTLLLVGLGLLNRRLARFYGPVGQWLILAPIWIGGIYLLFQALETFLPPSL